MSELTKNEWQVVDAFLTDYWQEFARLCEAQGVDPDVLGSKLEDAAQDKANWGACSVCDESQVVYEGRCQCCGAVSA